MPQTKTYFALQVTQKSNTKQFLADKIFDLVNIIRCIVI